MGDVMKFPERIDDFIEQYSFQDDERTYTNGSKLIPVFRVKQAIEHYMQKWIPCSERLPDTDEFVLVAVSGIYNNLTFSDAIKLGAYDKQENEWFIEGYPEWENPDVIAWQPLPEPYKPGKE